MPGDQSSASSPPPKQKTFRTVRQTLFACFCQTWTHPSSPLDRESKLVLGQTLCLRCSTPPLWFLLSGLRWIFSVIKQYLGASRCAHRVTLLLVSL